MRKKLVGILTVALTTLVVAGPNLTRVSGSDTPRWSLRRPEDDQDKALEVEMICLKDVKVVSATGKEKGFGCQLRAQGEICDIADVAKGLVPVVLDGCTPEFRLSKAWDAQQVKLSHLVMLPNGDALGVVSEKLS